MKICVIGTHGTGKTTLSYQLASYYKTEGKNVKLINEVARSCPFALNSNFNSFGAMWIIHRHITKELEAIARHADIVISDRSPIDSVMYARVAGVTVGQHMKNLIVLSEEWMQTYDQIYYVRPDSEYIAEDGVRSVDQTFQKKVEHEFDDWMEDMPYHISKNVKIIPTSHIFNKHNCWK